MTEAIAAMNLSARDSAPDFADRPRPRRRTNTGDRFFAWLLRASSLIPILLMVLFLTILIVGALPSIKAYGLGFLWSTEWDPSEDREAYGALPFIYGTLVSSFFALAIAAPVGIGVATFLNEIFPDRPRGFRGTVAFLIEILATIPSIVYGVWAFFVMVPWVE